MAISWIENKSGGTNNAGAITLTFTTALTAGDLVLVIHASGDTVDNVMPAPSAGGTYTDVGTSEQYVNATNDANSKAWYHYATGGETLVTLAGTGGGTNCGTSAACMVFRGVASAAQGGPFSTAITKTTGSGSGHANPPSIATAADDWVVIMGTAAHATAGVTMAAGANYTTNANAGTAGSDTISSGAGMAYRASGYGNPEDPPAFTASATAAGDSWTAVTLALKAAPAAQTVTGLVLTITPSLPTGSLAHTITGLALTVAPSLPVGKLNHSITGVALTVAPSLPVGVVTDVQPPQQVDGVVLTIAPTLPAGSLTHTVTGAALTVTPSLPAGSLRHTITGTVLTVTPTLPTGVVNRSITGVALTVTPSLPTGVITRSITGVVLTVVPTLPVGSASAGAQIVDGVALTVTPTLPVGTLSHTLVGLALAVTPTLPAGALTHTVTGVVLTVTPTLSVATVVAGDLASPVKGPTRKLVLSGASVEAESLSSGLGLWDDLFVDWADPNFAWDGRPLVGSSHFGDQGGIESLNGDATETEELVGAPRAVLIGAGHNSTQEA